MLEIFIDTTSVVDPDPPYVFRPPGSGPVIIFTDLDPSLFVPICHYLYGSGSGSFHHQANIVRKTSFSTVLFCDFFDFYL
jgi:hypothetical protein